MTPDMQPVFHDSGNVGAVLMGIGELKTSVAVISTKLDNIESRGTDHESRIRSLERFRWTVLGAASIAGGGLGYLASYLGQLHH